MKRGMDFFGTSKRRTRVQCHVDGISIPGVGSMRLSNIPKNLWKMCNLLVTVSQKASSVLLYGVALGAVATRGAECRIGEDHSNIYLNHSQRNSFLWIQYLPKVINLVEMKETCSFSMANQQPGNYEQIGCFCDELNKLPLSSTIILFGQNLTNESVSCIESFLSNCNYTQDYKGQMKFFRAIFIISLVYGGVLVAACLASMCPWCYDPSLFLSDCSRCFENFNRRREEPDLLLLHQGNQRQPNYLLNPVTEELSEQPTENNRTWCCFRR